MNADQPERPVQRFTDDYLMRCRSLSPADIVRFLDNFRVVAAAGAAERNTNRSRAECGNISEVEAHMAPQPASKGARTYSNRT